MDAAQIAGLNCLRLMNDTTAGTSEHAKSDLLYKCNISGFSDDLILCCEMTEKLSITFLWAH